MSKTCKKLLASALAATMLFSTFVSSLVVSAAATGTLKIGTETITVGTESATVDFTLTFSEAVAAPHDLATIVAKNANEETLTITAAELGEVVYVVDGVEQNTPYIDGIAPDDEVEPPSVSVESTNLTAGKILFGSGVASAADVKVINFTVTFDTTTATVGTYTVTATTDGTDYDEADVVVTTEDGAIVVEEPVDECEHTNLTEYTIADVTETAFEYVGTCPDCNIVVPKTVYIGETPTGTFRCAKSILPENDLSLLFKYPKDDVKNFSERVLVVTKEIFEKGATNATTDEFYLTDFKDEMSGTTPVWTYKFSNIAAYEVVNKVTAVLYGLDSTGKMVPLKKEVYSVYDYVNNTLSKSNTSDKLRTALVDLLNYAATTQLLLDVNVADLANSEKRMSETWAAWGTPVEDYPTASTQYTTNDIKTTNPNTSYGVIQFGKSLLPASKVNIKVKMNLKNYTGDTSDLYIVFNYYDSDKNIQPKTYTFDKTIIDIDGNRYFLFDEAPINMMDYPVSFSLYNVNSDVPLAVGGYSVETYISKGIKGEVPASDALKTNLAAMYVYGLSNAKVSDVPRYTPASN